jgi:hypothetical protein
MDAWYKFLLGIQFSTQKIDTLQQEFIAFYKLASDEDVREAVMLSKNNRNGTMIYFSPQACKIAQPLLKKYGAQPCDKPSVKIDADGHLLGRLAGDQKYYDVNFPPDPSMSWGRK